MKILNTIYKILASICMVLFLTFVGATLLWVMFDVNREWSMMMPVWGRFVFLVFMLIVSSLAIYVDYLRSRKEENK